jgi:hypothetical protein
VSSVQQDWVSHLSKAINTTFASMAFMDVNETPDGRDLSYSHVISIAINAPQPGRILLFLPQEVKKMVVENIYGRPWKELKSGEIDDCLLELLNVLAGNMLEALCGEDHPRSISLPELHFSVSDLGSTDDCVELFFDAEGELFKASICGP